MGDMDVVLGMKWLHEIREFTLNLRTMEMKFEVNGIQHMLRGISDGGLRVVSLKRMERLIRHDQVQWAAEIMVMPAVSE